MKVIKLLIIILFLSSPLSDAGAKTFHLSANKEHYKSALVGDWTVSTKVIWSDCPYVEEGNKAFSSFNISEANGRLFPHWDANNWQLVKNKSINFSGDYFTWERENKLYEHGQYWFVKSLDKFEMVSSKKLKAKSLVKQYRNGKFVGSYITQSTLTKNNF